MYDGRKSVSPSAVSNSATVRGAPVSSRKLCAHSKDGVVNKTRPPGLSTRAHSSQNLLVLYGSPSDATTASTLRLRNESSSASVSNRSSAVQSVDFSSMASDRSDSMRMACSFRFSINSAASDAPAPVSRIALPGRINVFSHCRRIIALHSLKFAHVGWRCGS